MLKEVCGDPEEVGGAVEPEVVLPGWLVLPQVPPRQSAGDLRLTQAVHRRAKVDVTVGIGRAVEVPADGSSYSTPHTSQNLLSTRPKAFHEKLRLAEVDLGTV